ncbi:MAG: Na-K-Cl cotransporter [Candidatus Delongbacteria bacterium]|nr:Na-K-Cl cotransporter [Candidatus Delongbacteria bacterium]MBN2837110.1 Na-K-Cl cotransporter [Candidatus Delongbacteria bacterium]
MTEAKKLGTFVGVFTPTILTILGVIMYMRIGWVVGHTGLINTLIIVALSNTITLITTLSFSSVATNIKVGAGGAYYIISRSLGLEIGGSIGFPLFLSQALSVTLYSFGLAEAMLIVLPSIDVQITAAIIIVIVGVISYFGAEFALKSQVPLMILIVISIFFLIVGAIIHNKSGLQFTGMSGEVTFWEAFGVFFPAVTGVMAGLGMSGDLKEPSKAIPRGAISACLVGFGVYLSIPIILNYGASSSDLQSNQLIWTEVAPLGMFIVLPALFGAIFSSAIGSVLNAPRTMTALSEDLIINNRKMRRLFTGEKGLRNNLFVTILIALSAVLIGDLNSIAPIVSMFFLTVYGMVNLVAAIESFSSATSWRPKFKTPWIINIIGFLGCMSVMFLISPLETLVAVIFEIVLYFLLVRSETRAKWGDARRGFWEAIIRKALINLSNSKVTPRNWRPNILLFLNEYTNKGEQMAKFASWFCLDKGLVSVFKILSGDIEDCAYLRSKTYKELKSYFDEKNITVFPEVAVVDDLSSGIIDISQANGFAGLESNTIMLGWSNKLEKVANLLSIIRKLETINKSVIISKISSYSTLLSEKKKQIIHIWWGGLQHNGDLMLLFAHLLSLNTEWRNSKIQIISIIPSEFIRVTSYNNLRSLIEDSRIKAEPVILVNESGRSVFDIITEFSSDADVVFMGLKVPEIGEELQYSQTLEKFASKFDTLFYILNSSLFTGSLLENR